MDTKKYFLKLKNAVICSINADNYERDIEGNYVIKNDDKVIMQIKAEWVWGIEKDEIFLDIRPVTQLTSNRRKY